MSPPPPPPDLLSQGLRPESSEVLVRQFKIVYAQQTKQLLLELQNSQWKWNAVYVMDHTLLPSRERILDNDFDFGIALFIQTITFGLNHTFLNDTIPDQQLATQATNCLRCWRDIYDQVTGKLLFLLEMRYKYLRPRFVIPSATRRREATEELRSFLLRASDIAGRNAQRELVWTVAPGQAWTGFGLGTNERWFPEAVQLGIGEGLADDRDGLAVTNIEAHPDFTINAVFIEWNLIRQDLETRYGRSTRDLEFVSTNADRLELSVIEALLRSLNSFLREVVAKTRSRANKSPSAFAIYSEIRSKLVHALSHAKVRSKISYPVVAVANVHNRKIDLEMILRSSMRSHNWRSSDSPLATFSEEAIYANPTGATNFEQWLPKAASPDTSPALGDDDKENMDEDDESSEDEDEVLQIIT